MKKLTLLMALFVWLIASSVVACEYSIYEKRGAWGTTFQPVIVGINAPNNLITAWYYDHNQSIPNPDLDRWVGQEKFDSVDGTSSIIVPFYARPIHVIRQTQEAVAGPLTIHIDVIGVGCAFTPSAVWVKPLGVPEFMRDPHGKFRLYYRIAPSPYWILAKEGEITTFTAGSQLATVPTRGTRVLQYMGNNLTEGTKIQFMIKRDNGTFYDDMEEGPESFDMAPPTVLDGTTPDFITVTISGKRRPRHDQ